MNRPAKDRPEWWDWEIELTPPLLKRMLDRGFSEVDLRLMLTDASEYAPSSSPHRFILQCEHLSEVWEVVVEPDETDEVLLVITAYRKDQQ